MRRGSEVRMNATERIINDLYVAKLALCNPHLTPEMCVKVGQAISNAIDILKGQEVTLLENQHKPYGFSTNANSPWISRCSRCGKKIEGKQMRFCKYCGKEARWE